MKKKITRIIAVILVVLLGLVGVIAVAVDIFASAEGQQPERDKYTFKIDVLDELEAVRVDQELNFTNRTGQPISQVLFNLYANAYRRQTTAPFESESMNDAFWDGYTPGGIDFFTVEVDGSAADWGVQGAAESFIRVAVELQPGESCNFHFAYELLLPRALGNLGVTNTGYQLNKFYPSVSPWDKSLGEFSVANVSAIGDNVYAEVADFEAHINVPRGCALATGGDAIGADDGDRTVWTVNAPGIRQFAFEFSNKYRQYSRSSGSGRAVSCFMANKSDAEYALDVAVDALDLFEDLLGDYPLNALSIVQAEEIGAVATESGMIRLDDSLLGRWQRSELEYNVVFGVAKQWFSEKVGHNPAREPWLSEAASEYMTLVYYKHAYGNDRFMTELNARVLPALQLTVPGGVTVDSETQEFSSVREYELVIRERGAAVLYEVAHSIGEDALIAALNKYTADNWGAIASIAEFAAALNESSGSEIDYLLMEMLRNIGDYVNQDLEFYE